MSDDLTRVTFGEPYALEAADFVRSLYWEHRVADVTGSLGDLGSSQAAMQYVSPAILEHPELGDVVDIAPTPSYRQRGQVSGANMWVIFDTSPVKDDAWAWISFVSEIENMVGISRLTRTLPPRMSAVQYSPQPHTPHPTSPIPTPTCCSTGRST